MRYANLLREFAVSDFKIRYQDSALGYLWSFIKPLFMFGVLYIVFSLFLGFNVPYYPAYLFLGIIIWNFFVEATIFSMHSIINRGDLIKKIYFPRNIIVISSNVTAFFTFLLNLSVFTIFFFLQHVPLKWTVAVFPLFILELFLIALGSSLLLAALNVTFRDLGHIWEIVLQMGFWITPVMYSVDMIPQKYHFALYLNPMTRIIQYSRNVVIDGRLPHIEGIAASFIVSCLVFLIGHIVFTKMAPHFAEKF